MTVPLRPPISLKLYRAMSKASAPIAKFALSRRVKAGKEDPARLHERRGAPTRPRPQGTLIWIHGASVGESLSIIPLVTALLDARPDIHVMVTTGTITSASMIEDWLPERAFHQYIPIDHPDFVRGFLDHWCPQTAIFIESELWPNLIMIARERVEKMAIVNGRMSPNSFEDWKRQPNLIRYLLSAFDVIIAQDTQNAERLAHLSSVTVETFGNLKAAASDLPAFEDELGSLRSAIGARPVWLAASTHPGEEEIILGAHKSLKQDYPALLTVVAPRHPKRGDEISDLCANENLTSLRRAVKTDEDQFDHVEIYIADTLGELGLFYRLCNIAFVGGSLVDKGGHNPLEPARLNCAILHGPNIFNFAETYEQLRRAGGSALVRNERELATAIRRLHQDSRTQKAMASAAYDAARENSEKVVIDVSSAVLALLPPAGAHP